MIRPLRFDKKKTVFLINRIKKKNSFLFFVFRFLKRFFEAVSYMARMFFATELYTTLKIAQITFAFKSRLSLTFTKTFKGKNA